jgi:Predicted glycosyltransferases
MREDDMATISAIIPTFYRYEALEDTIKDLLSQTVPPHQIIIIDNTTLVDRKKPEYLSSPSFDRCLYISSSCEGRVNIARNEGLRQVTADFAVLLDDDMHLPEDFLANILQVHSEGWDAVTGVVIEDGQPLDTPGNGNRPLWAVLRHHRKDSRCHTIAVPSCLISMRTAMIKDLGYLDEAFIYSYDDYDLGLRIWEHGYTLIYDSRVLAHHLKLPRGGSRQILLGRKRVLNKYTAKYYFLSKHFSERAVRIEFINDIMLTLWDRRAHPLRAIEDVFLACKAFRRFPKYLETGAQL